MCSTTFTFVAAPSLPLVIIYPGWGGAFDVRVDLPLRGDDREKPGNASWWLAPTWAPPTPDPDTYEHGPSE